MTGEVRLTEAELSMFRREAGLGVCSDPRGEFGRDYRILALLVHVAALTQDRDEARAVVEAVRALHKPSLTYVGPDFCRTCSDLVHEWVPWPCPTGALLPPTEPTAEALGEAGAGGGPRKEWISDREYVIHDDGSDCPVHGVTPPTETEATTGGEQG